MPAPAPLARRGRFPVRQSPPRLDQLSLPGLLAVAESALALAADHAEMAEGLRPMVRVQRTQTLALRKQQAAYALRLVETTGEVMSEREVAR